MRPGGIEPSIHNPDALTAELMAYLQPSGSHCALPSLRSVHWRSAVYSSAIYLFGVIALPNFATWLLGEGVPGARNIRKSGANPPKFVGFRGGAAKFWLSVTFRSVPWRPAVCLLSAVVSYPPPNWTLGKGGPGARNIREFLKKPPKFVGFRGGVAKF